MKKIIHVNRHHIAANKRDGGKRPIHSVKTYKKTCQARRVRLLDGPAIFVDIFSSNRKPLSCGAPVWQETCGRVRVDGIII